MSRIKFDELCYMDVEWYGVDKCGNIAVFCSAGKADVPEFVCADKEKYEKLVELFDSLPIISDTLLCFKQSKSNQKPAEVAENFCKKGIYYYDSDDGSRMEENISTLQSYYTLLSKPVFLLKFQNLPIEMQELLKDNFLSIDDFGKTTVIEVEAACHH